MREQERCGGLAVLPAGDTFDLLAKIYDQDSATAARRRDDLVAAFGVGRFLDRPVRTLSLGERMRLELVASLLHAPEVLFLDEPTIGLDVSAKAALRDLVRERSERDGLTLLLTSHDTGDIERVCHRAVVINHGRLLWDGPLPDLRRRYLKSRRITLWSESERLTLALPGVRVLASRPYFTEIELEAHTTPVGAVVEAASRQGLLHDLAIEDAPLDEVIRNLYQNEAAP